MRAISSGTTATAGANPPGAGRNIRTEAVDKPTECSQGHVSNMFKPLPDRGYQHESRSTW